MDIADLVGPAVVAAIFGLVAWSLNRNVAAVERDLAAARQAADKAQDAADAARNDLAAYKLEVAQRYASTGYLKDVEQRLMEHLGRIERGVQQLQQAMLHSRVPGE
ncbi:MAG TPA: hypothetical protein VEB20_03240 [Azospirillaceae bacterium]|nr:hypothetical protein [Azospirillaceae bacterium]